ncbi:unnamed protein product [Sphagnum compactum]
MDLHQRCVGKSTFLMSGRRRLNCVQQCKHLHLLCDLTPMSLHAIHSEHQAMTFGFGHFWQAAYLQQLVNIHYSTPALVKEISSRPIPLGFPNTGLEWKEKRTHHFHP